MDRYRGIAGLLALVAMAALPLRAQEGPVESRLEARKVVRAAGLTVTPWTFRSSNTGSFPSVRAEMETFLYDHGVDAVFTDNPDQFPRR